MQMLYAISVILTPSRTTVLPFYPSFKTSKNTNTIGHQLRSRCSGIVHGFRISPTLVAPNLCLFTGKDIGIESLEQRDLTIILGRSRRL